MFEYVVNIKNSWEDYELNSSKWAYEMKFILYDTFWFNAYLECKCYFFYIHYVQKLFYDQITEFTTVCTSEIDPFYLYKKEVNFAHTY